MQSKRVYLFTFLSITVINVAIFIFRNYFNYQPYASYDSLYAPCDEACLQKWKQFADDYSSELKEANQITDSIVRGYTNTTDKVVAIENFLYTKFHTRVGLPTMDIQRSSPLNKYKKLSSSDKLKLWCGDYALMLSLFCWSQGIVNRNIELKHEGDHHSLNECYIPESKSWMMADITNNLLATTTNDGKLINLITFKNSLKKKEELKVVQSTGDGTHLDTLELKSLKMPIQFAADDPINFYYYTDNDEAYLPSRKFKRYLLPVSWYDTYNYKKKNNLVFYLKDSFIFLWLVSFFVFLASRTKFRS